jgi:hypothetical protein
MTYHDDLTDPASKPPPPQPTPADLGLDDDEANDGQDRPDDADTGTYDGPAIMDGLRRSRAAHEAGDRDEALAIVERLREEHGDVPVDAIIAGLRTGFMTLDPVED